MEVRRLSQRLTRLALDAIIFKSRLREPRQPQHLARPSLELIDGTPSTGLSVTSDTPVLKKSSPGDGTGFLPVLAYSTAASTPSEAISSGYCCAVAPIAPAATFFTPGQPPSTDTMRVLLSLPAAFSAPYAPAAVGSLIV